MIFVKEKHVLFGLGTMSSFQKMTQLCTNMFEGLTITTRAATCGLPGFPVKLVFGADELKGSEYVEYLAAYAGRFALDVRCNMEVVEIQEADGEWKISVRQMENGSPSTLTCDELVVATGKNAVPHMPSCYTRADLQGAQIIHSSQLQGHRFQEAVSAAAADRLLVVGFGNSAVDICSSLLRQCTSGSVHVSMRRRPPIVRRQWGFLRLEWFARLFSNVCDKNGDRFTNWLMYMIEGDVESLFPDLDTWGARQERHIPTVDRDGSLLRHVRERRIIPHPGLESILLSCDETGSETAGDAAIGPHPRPVQVKFFGESAPQHLRCRPPLHGLYFKLGSLRKPSHVLQSRGAGPGAFRRFGSGTQRSSALGGDRP